MPGHESVRKNRLREYLPITVGIIFMIDAFDVMSNINATAE